MAIARGAGTEIIRTAMFEDVAGAGTKNLIIGEQHHIYTVLSIVMYTVNAAGYIDLMLNGYDSNGGTTAQDIVILSRTLVAAETFVWNDKFSFFGYEPSSNTQLARAAQGSNTPQYLKVETGSTDCKVDVTCTFIDQDWS